MNKIPAPTSNNYSNYDSYPYGESLRQSMAGYGQEGGYSSYGIGGGQSSDVQSYIQYMHRYEQMLMAYRQAHHDPQSLAMIDQYLAKSKEYLASVGDFSDDSMTGGDFGDFGNYGASNTDSLDGTPAPQYGEMIWQDGTRQKWDGADPVVYPVNQQSSKLQQDFFQSDVTIQNPYHGATGKAELVDDDSVAGAKMLKVTFTGTDGSTKVVCVHNVTDKSNIKIQSADQSNIHLDASLASSPLASQVTVEDLSSTSTDSTGPQGDQPTKRKDGKLGYDGDSFDIYSKEDGKTKYISARHDVRFHASSNSEYWTIWFNDETQQYEINVYDDPKDRTSKHLKETFFVDDMTNLKIKFDIDPSHMSFIGDLWDPADGGDLHKTNPSNPHAQKLSFDTGDEESETPTDGQAVNSKYKDTDTKADHVTANKATYNNSTDVEIHALGKLMEYDITAPGNITLHGTSYSDTMEIEKYDAATHTWTIKSYKDGIRDAAHTETFTIHGSEKTKVTLDVMDKNSLVDKDGKVETDALKLGSVQIGSSGSTSTDDKASKIISDLKAAAGNKTDDQLLSALNAAGLSYAKIDDLKAAMNATPPSFPPAFSTDPGSDFNKLINALYALDGTLSGALNSLKDTWDGNTANSGYSTGTNELVKLLQKLYPEHNISMTYPTGDWGKRDVITFDTVNFHYASYFDGGDDGRHSTFEGIKLSPAS